MTVFVFGDPAEDTLEPPFINTMRLTGGKQGEALWRPSHHRRTDIFTFRCRFPGNAAHVFLLDGGDGAEQDESVSLVQPIVRPDCLAGRIHCLEEDSSLRVEINPESDGLLLSSRGEVLPVLAEFEAV